MLRFEHHYGPFKDAVSVIQDVTGVQLAGRIPLPRFEDQTPEGRLRLARQILLRGPMLERYRFAKNELSTQRPFNQDYRDLILDFIERTKFSGEGYYQMIPYIAWLAAGDSGFAPVIAKLYVERAANSPNGAGYAQSLSYFGPDILQPYTAQLLALYERRFANQQDTERFRASLTLGIGGGGPAVIDKLLEELSVPTSQAAASAAVSLCRAGDPRAVEPLLEKLRESGRADNPMSYAYALARLGFGNQARDAVSRVRGPQSSEFACLNEIVGRYPSGGSPISTCLLQGPHKQAEGAEWQFSESQLRCLAPRTPSPNG